MALIIKPDSPWPSLGAWLVDPDIDDFHRGIALRALQDDGHREQPRGSNRSPYLDGLCVWAGIPLASWWCALWAGRVFADGHAKIPHEWANTDTWLPYLVDAQTILPRRKRVGCAIVYGKRGTGGVDPDWRVMKARGWDAQHIGIVVDWTLDPDDFTLTTEGNRGYVGTPTNNGVAVDTAPTYRKDILGLVVPVPV